MYVIRFKREYWADGEWTALQEFAKPYQSVEEAERVVSKRWKHGHKLFVKKLNDSTVRRWIKAPTPKIQEVDKRKERHIGIWRESLVR